MHGIDAHQIPTRILRMFLIVSIALNPRSQAAVDGDIVNISLTNISPLKLVVVLGTLDGFPIVIFMVSMTVQTIEIP